MSTTATTLGRGPFQPRSKTIQAHVVLFGAFAARMALGAFLRVAERLAPTRRPFAGIPAERITTRVASRWVFDEG